ncbi:hypothetical protein [Companilactobacillus kedongensis]|uniref:hypothetical protein n=1 Tax=Companilactobacillus kedongensis TaxID=2486004 RepID=UPI000F76C7CF|nr:hypothetical protein [Companilactobacillus kedongensis]
MGHWEPGRVFQEMNWVEDDGGCGCGCGCIVTIIAIVALMYGISFIMNYLGVIIIIGIAIFVLYLILK